MEVQKFLEIFDQHPFISTDTRKIEGGEIFFALKGENFDGNLYVENALNKGASFVVTEDSCWKDNENVIVVEDVLVFLQSVARAYRDTLNCKVIGITGTNGKTTTKELCHAVLNKQFKTHATKGNYNNHIGVPLTILAAPKDIEMMIIEMGANHIGEIDALCRIADPDIGIITNIGKAHLEGFVNLEGVIKAKVELYNYLDKKDGIIIYNPLDKILIDNIPEGIKQTIPYLPAQLIRVNPCVEMKVANHLFHSSLFGAYNATNILCAITIAKFLNVSEGYIYSSISNYKSKNNRSEIREYRDATIVLDAYNANPTSMEASLSNFEKTKEGEKIVVLGDMLELGKFSKVEHQRIFNLANNMPFNNIILVGDEFSNVVGAENIFKNVEDAKKYFDTLDFKGLSILIKGSRGIKLELLISED